LKCNKIVISSQKIKSRDNDHPHTGTSHLLPPSPFIPIENYITTVLQQTKPRLPLTSNGEEYLLIYKSGSNYQGGRVHHLRGEIDMCEVG
jgi:hypothetical protein